MAEATKVLKKEKKEKLLTLADVEGLRGKIRESIYLDSIKLFDEEKRLAEREEALKARLDFELEAINRERQHLDRLKLTLARNIVSEAPEALSEEEPGEKGDKR